jgi:hypothetical protein
MKHNFYWKQNLEYIMYELKQSIVNDDLSLAIADVSYLADVCPSVSIEGFSESQSYYLFCPNSYRDDMNGSNLEFKGFTLIKSEDYGFAQNNAIEFADLEAVINYLPNL